MTIDNSASGRGISGTVGSSTSPSLALDKNARPVIAWDEEVNFGTGVTPSLHAVLLRRWTGSMWQESDGSATGFGIVHNYSAGATTMPRLAIDGQNQLVVGWIQYSNSVTVPYEIYVRRFNVPVQQWQDLDNGGITSASGGGVSNAGNPTKPNWVDVAADWLGRIDV